MLLTILSALGGGLLRLLPELMVLFNKRTDNVHELAMLDRQLQIEATRGKNRTDEIDHMSRATLSEAEMRGGIDLALRSIDLHSEALKGQMQKIGIWWVDALNWLVRPVTAFYFLGCYGIVKTAMIFVSLRTLDSWASIVQCWTDQDYAMLYGVLGFYFVGRSFDKKQ